MSRTRRSVQTLATGLVSSAATAVASFITAPFLLEWIGDDRFGAFRAAIGWLGFIGLLEFGVSGALLALFARSLGVGDRVGVVAVLLTGARVYLLIAVLMAAASAALMVTMPSLIRLPASLTKEFRIGCALYLFNFAFLPLGPFRSLAEAAQRGYVVNVLLAFQSLVVATAAVFMAYEGWGLVGQFAALVFGCMVFHLGLAWDGIRCYPEVLSRGMAKDGVGRSLWTLSWPTLLFNLSGRIGLLSDELVVAGLLGPTAVASFFLTQRVIAVAGTQVQALGSATWAGLIDLYFRGEREVFVRRFTQISRLTAILGSGTLMPVAVFNRYMIILWVGSDRYAGAGVTWLAAANALGLGVLSVWLWPLSAAGLVRATLPLMICSTVVNLVVSLGATMTIGLTGPLIGSATAFAGVNWWWTLLILRQHLGVPPRHLLVSVAGPIILAIPYGVGLMVLVKVVSPFNPVWPRWVGILYLAGWITATAGGYFMLAWFLVLPAADRSECVGLYRGRLRHVT